MAHQGVDLTSDANEASTSISWHLPHPIFAIILVGAEEHPFGIQKDLLCAQSPYFRDEFARMPAENTIERILKLPDTDVETFGCFQNFIYTGKVYDKDGGREIPDYTLLMSVWKLATNLKMAPLRVAVLDVMAERREKTECIPGTPLLVQAWKETEEGSGLRRMLVGWAAEHMRSSPHIRNDFAKSLPQEILSELVITMSSYPASPAPIYHSPFLQPDPQQQPRPSVSSPQTHSKRPRQLDVLPGAPPTPAQSTSSDLPQEIKPPLKKPRRSEPTGRATKPSSSIRRTSTAFTNTSTPTNFSTPEEKDLAFCRHLITRMLSGPGFWTRLVGPFTNPVDPITDNAPNYFSVVKKPMCLKVIKQKLDRGEYKDAQGFEDDMRLIWQNCYEYWTQEDPVFRKCGEFERYFLEQWGKRGRWVPGVGGGEGVVVKPEVID